MRTTFFTLAALAVATLAGAQNAPTVQQAAVVAPPQVEPYVYQPDGRRDPFLSLINGGVDPKATLLKKDGLRTFLLAEISVRGVMQTRDALVAMVQGPDNRTYVIHQGDKLADAVVKSVTAQGLVAMQDVSDPLSTQKQREVRKLLRSLEGAEK